MKKIVFYNETLMSGGIEKCIESLIEYLYPQYKIEIVYIDENKLDPHIVKILERKAYVHKLDTNTVINADICIWCRLYMDYNLLKQYITAKKNLLWVHSKPRERKNCLLDNRDFLNTIDDIICVSQTVQKQLLVDKHSVVIHNFLPYNIKDLSKKTINEKILYNTTALKFVTVSRLSSGKGFDRILKLVKALESNNINFEYIIIGKGRDKEYEIKSMFSNTPNVKFIGYKDNPYPYISRADYLVQLSDFETWGNVITEAKYLNTPVIITSFESAYEQVEHNYNGIIIDLYDTDYQKYIPMITQNLNKYKANLNNFIYNNEIKKWIEIFN